MYPSLIVIKFSLIFEKKIGGGGGGETEKSRYNYLQKHHLEKCGGGKGKSSQIRTAMLNRVKENKLTQHKGLNI